MPVAKSGASGVTTILKTIGFAKVHFGTVTELHFRSKERRRTLSRRNRGLPIPKTLNRSSLGCTM